MNRVFQVLIALCLLWSQCSVMAQPDATPMLPGNITAAQYGFNAGMAANTNEVVQSQHPAFKEAVRVTVAQKPPGAHQTLVSLGNAKPIKKGDVIAVAFYGRAAAPTTDGSATLYVQGAPDWSNPFVTLPAQLAPAWKQFSTQFVARDDRAVGDMRFNIFLGQQEQVVEIGGFRVANFGATPEAGDVAQFLAPRSTFKTNVPSHKQDFEGAFVPVVKRPTSVSSVVGNIPAGWTEDSSWQGANVKIDYAKFASGTFAGKGALRIKVEDVKSGVAQLRLDNIRLDKTTYMKLRIALRSPTTSQVRLGIRNATQYYDYWSQLVTAVPEWGVREFLIPPMIDDLKAQFMIYMDRPTVVEIDEFSLVPVSAAVANTRTYAGNLLPGSSFPVGLAKPWVANGAGEAPNNWSADVKVIGPTGLPSLRVVAPYTVLGSMAQVSAPFEGKAGVEHTFSVHIKGARDGQVIHLRMGPPSENLWEAPYQKNITTTTDWQRVSWTVKLPFVAEGFYLARLTTHDAGEFWVDGAQVEVGAQATAFQRTAQTEIALMPQKNFGLHRAGEALALSAAVYGNVPAGATLKGKLLDIEDREFVIAPVKLQSGQKLQRVPISIARGKEPPLGLFLVEMTVYDAKGKAISRPVESVLGRVRAPRKAEVFAPDSPFGIHLRHDASHIDMAQELGFKWARLFGMSWAKVEDVPGQWDWSLLDPLVKRYHDRKFSLLGVLGEVPRRASLVPKDFNQWNVGAAVVKPENMKDWGEYARRIGERYKGKITHWETWNEPDLPSFYFQDYKDGNFVHGTPQQLIEMSRAAAKGLKAADPKNTVFWNMASSREESMDFARKVVAQGIYDAVDSLSYHQYMSTVAGFPGDQIEERIGQFSTLLPPNHKMPMWNTEGGPAGNGVRSAYRLTPPLDGRSRATFWGDYVVRYYVSTLANGADKFFLYNYSGGSWTPNYELLNADGSLSANAVAFSNLAWHLEGRKFFKIIPLNKDVNAYMFEGGGDSVAVVLSKGIGRLDLKRLPKGLAARDLYGNDVKFPAKLGNQATFIEGKGLKTEALAAKLKS